MANRLAAGPVVRNCRRILAKKAPAGQGGPCAAAIEATAGLAVDEVQSVALRRLHRRSPACLLLQLLDVLELSLLADLAHPRVDSREAQHPFFPALRVALLVTDLLTHSEQPAASLELLLTMPVGQEAVIADAMESRWQDVLKKSPDKLDAP